MKKALLVLLLVSGAALGDDAGCRGIADATARLACYDALPLPAGSDAAAKSQAVTPAPSAPAAAAAVAAPAATAAQQAQQEFGLPPKTPRAELQNIESYIPGHFEGWEPRMRITLANGQV
jgi:hypothetical protein